MNRVTAVIAGIVIAAFAAPTVAAQKDDQVAKGMKVYEQQKCSVCHSIEGKGNKKGPLDGVGSKLSADEIRQWIVNAKEMTAKTKSGAEAADEGLQPAEGGARRTRRLHAEPEEEVRFGVSMALRFLTAGAVALVLTASVAAQSTDRPPANDDCLACHSAPSAARATGQPVVVLPESAASVHAPLACVDCHADLAKVTEFPHPEKLARVSCSTCHEDGVVEIRSRCACTRAPGGSGEPRSDVRRLSHRARDQGRERSDINDLQAQSRRRPAPAVTAIPRSSAAGSRPERAGVVPRQHPRPGARESGVDRRAGVRRLPPHARHPAEERSREPVHRTNVPATCGTCHAGVAGSCSAPASTAWRSREACRGAPACQTCHTAHGIQRTEPRAGSSGRSRSAARATPRRSAPIRDTFHGQVQSLGFARIAKCADCHTAHAIHPKEDPRSSVSPANAVGHVPPVPSVGDRERRGTIRTPTNATASAVAARLLRGAGHERAARRCVHVLRPAHDAVVLARIPRAAIPGRPGATEGRRPRRRRVSGTYRRFDGRSAAARADDELPRARARPACPCSSATCRGRRCSRASSAASWSRAGSTGSSRSS